MYDFARAQGLPKAQARAQTIKAREMCGEEEYDSENSALGDELDDSKAVLRCLSTISAVKSTSSEVLPSIETKEVLDVRPLGQEHVGPMDAKNDAPNIEGNEFRTQTPKGQAGDMRMPDAPFNVGQTVKDSKTEAKDPPMAQQDSVAIEKCKADLKAKRREKKAKKRAGKDGLTGQESLAKNHDPGPGGAVLDTVIPPPTKGPNDPKSEAEAHENFLKSNERDPHGHDQTREKSQKELKETKKRSTAFLAELRASRDFANEHAIDLYNQGKYKGASKQMRDDLKEMAAERRAMEEDKAKMAKAESASKKSKKRKSIATDDVEDRIVSKKKKRNSNEHAQPRDLPNFKTSDFHSPMIQ